MAAYLREQALRQQASGERPASHPEVIAPNPAPTIEQVPTVPTSEQIPVVAAPTETQPVVQPTAEASQPTHESQAAHAAAKVIDGQPAGVMPAIPPIEAKVFDPADAPNGLEVHADRVTAAQLPETATELEKALADTMEQMGNSKHTNH
jgi:hypothetical protein